MSFVREPVQLGLEPFRYRGLDGLFLGRRIGWIGIRHETLLRPKDPNLFDSLTSNAAPDKVVIHLLHYSGKYVACIRADMTLVGAAVSRH